MNRLGMMVDISHVSDETFWDVIETAKAPVIASHSGCRTLSKIARNMTDEMISAVAGTGGMVAMNVGCEFLSQESADGSPDTNPALKGKAGIVVPRATLAQVADQIDHVVQLAGVDSVGIGTDFDGVECTPVGLDDVSKFPNLTRALLERGYTAADIRKIYGGNLLRVMRAVEQSAEETSYPLPNLLFPRRRFNGRDHGHVHADAHAAANQDQRACQKYQPLIDRMKPPRSASRS
jgi:membrane dipeptidase